MKYLMVTLHKNIYSRHCVRTVARHSTSFSRGFTLVELMVALAIGLLLTIGVVQIFSASRSTYQLDEGLARAQENGRFAIEFMSREIRHAAHLGCRRWEPPTGNPGAYNITSTLVGTPQDYTVNGVFGYEYTATSTAPGSTYPIPPSPSNTTTGWSPALPSGITGTGGAFPGSDIIGVERLVGTPVNIAATTTKTTTLQVAPAQANLFKINDIVLITDCHKGTMFQVTDVDLPTGTLTHDLGGSSPGNRCGIWEPGLTGSTNAAGDACTDQVYQTNAVIGPMATVYFFVAQDPTNNRPTLYQNAIAPAGGGVPAALVEGIENIQILYGVDGTSPPDGIPERYVPASSVPSFVNVVSIRLGVLVDSVNASGTATDTTVDTDTYNVAGTIIDPQNDRLKRRVFTTTIQLRNRGV